MGLPAAAVPVGRSPDGLPIGVQVIGRRDREMEVLAVAKELEQALGGWIRTREAVQAERPWSYEHVLRARPPARRSSATFRTASSTPGMNDSREIVSWRIESVWPRPPKITS